MLPSNKTHHCFAPHLPTAFMDEQGLCNVWHPATANRLCSTMGSRACFFSTSAVCGETRELPLTEKMECRSVNSYDSSKYTCKRMTEDFDKAFGIGSVRLRYFSAADARRDSHLRLCPCRRPRLRACSSSQISARGWRHPAMNLGTGHGTSVSGVVKEVEAATGRRVSLVEAPRRVALCATTPSDLQLG